MDRNTENQAFEIKIPEPPEEQTEKKKAKLPLIISLCTIGALIIASAIIAGILFIPLMTTPHWENTFNEIFLNIDELQKFSEATSEGINIDLSAEIDSETAGLMKDLNLKLSVASQIHDQKKKGSVTLSLGGASRSIALLIIYDEETAALGFYELSENAANDNISYVSFPRKGIAEEFKTSVFAPDSGSEYALEREVFNEIVSALEAFESADSGTNTESINSSVENIVKQIAELLQPKNSVSFDASSFSLRKQVSVEMTADDIRAIIDVIIKEAEANPDLSSLLNTPNYASYTDSETASILDALKEAKAELPEGEVLFSYTVTGNYVSNIRYAYTAPEVSDDSFDANLDFIYGDSVGFDILVKYENEEEKISYRKQKTNAANIISVTIDADSEVFEAKATHSLSNNSLLITAGMRGDTESSVEVRGNLNYNSDKSELSLEFKSIKIGSAEPIQGVSVGLSIKKNSDNIEIPTAEPFFDFSEAELTSYIENLPVNALNNVIIEYTGYAINSYISVDGKFIPHLSACVAVAGQYATLFSKYIMQGEEFTVFSVCFPSEELGLYVLIDYNWRDNMFYYNFAYEMTEELLDVYHVASINQSGKLTMHDLQFVSKKEATCSEEGYTEYHCSICQENLFSYTKKLDHVNLTVEKEVIADNGKVYTAHIQMCKTCGIIWTYEIPGEELLVFDRFNGTSCTISNYTMYSNNELTYYYGIPPMIEEMLNVTSFSTYSTISKTICVRIPKGVKELKSGTFRSAEKVQVLILPSTLNKIDSSAFSNSLKNLHTVFFCGTEKEWKALVLGDLGSVIDTVNVIFCPDGVTPDMISDVIFREDMTLEAVNANKDKITMSNGPSKEAAKQAGITLIHDGKIEQVIYDETSGMVAVCDEYNSKETLMSVYDIKTGNSVVSFKVSGDVALFDIREGHLAYACTDSTMIYIYNITTKQTVSYKAPSYSDISWDSIAAVYIHRGKVYASTVEQHCYLSYYDLSTGEIVKINQILYPSLYINRELDRIVNIKTTGSPKTVEFYDLNTNTFIKEIWLENRVHYITFMGDYLVDSAGNLFDLNGENLTTIPEGSEPIEPARIADSMILDIRYQDADGNLSIYVKKGYNICTIIKSTKNSSIPVILDYYAEKAIVTENGDFLIYTPGGYGLLLVNMN